MHTFFVLEDIYGLHIAKIDGKLCICLDKNKGTLYQSISDMFQAWQEQAEKLQSGEITKEEYDQWRYTYPQMQADKSRESIDALRTKRNTKVQAENK